MSEFKELDPIEKEVWEGEFEKIKTPMKKKPTKN